MRKIYLVDEFPLEENILKSSDYSSKIIYSFIGRPFLKIMNSKKEFIFSLLCDDKKLEIILNDTKYSDLFEQIFKKIIQYIYKIDQFNSIVIRNNLIDYQKNINEIIFNFKNIRSLRLFIQILKSYKFNMLLEESYRIDFKNKNIIKLKNFIKKDTIYFIKCRNIFLSLFFFFIGAISETPNIIFGNKLCKLLKKTKYFKTKESDITVFLVSTNTDSRFFNSLEMRRNIFEALSNEKIIKKYSEVISEPKFIKYSKSNFKIKKNKDEIVTISYDDYFPNKEICKELKKMIEQETSYKVKLVKTDFKKVKNTFDFRLHIIHNSYNNKFWLYYLLGIISPLRKMDKDIFNSYYSKLIEALENSKIDNSKFIKRINDNYCLFFPICTIKNNSLTRERKSIY
jgi:hypothetical protein